MRLAPTKHESLVGQRAAAPRGIARSAASLASWRRPATVAVALACALLIGVLLFAHLGETPRTWFDEGSHLHVPKTLVQTGHYADRSSEGFRAFGPTIGVGPTVMLPIAAVFEEFGVSLLKARLVIALYAVVALAAFALLLARVADRRLAALATMLLLAAPSVDFINTGRQVLGEVPALAYLLCGLLVWFARDDATGVVGLVRCTKRCIVAGGLFGLTIITKSQLGIVLLPALVVLALLALRWDRRIGLKQVVVPLVVMLVVFAGWELALLTIVTGGSLGENLALLRQASGGSLIVVAPHRALAAARFLLSPLAYFALLVPALTYGCVRAARRRMAVGEFVLLVLSLTGLLWFMAASVAWPRYAFVPLALAALPVARLLDDTVRVLWRHGKYPRRLAAGGIVALVILVALSLGNQLRTTFAAPNDAPQRMAAYLKESLPASTVIEAWEPELGFLTDHRYHFPAPAYLDIAVRHEWLGGGSLTGYDPQSGGAAYLVVGPFARYTGIYDEQTIAARGVRVAVIGDYTLYQLGR